jgi:hypothetical protein
MTWDRSPIWQSNPSAHLEDWPRSPAGNRPDRSAPSGDVFCDLPGCLWEALWHSSLSPPPAARCCPQRVR